LQEQKKESRDLFVEIRSTCLEAKFQLKEIQVAVIVRILLSAMLCPVSHHYSMPYWIFCHHHPGHECVFAEIASTAWSFISILYL
jgi:hypothetical protein